LTDYPDHALLDNLSYNVKANVPPGMEARVGVKGYIWGTPAGSLLSEIEAKALGSEKGSSEKFDLIILSDLVFNHSQV
jgi:EEF1A N-terminal glycine/lysine methyltransferase